VWMCHLTSFSCLLTGSTHFRLASPRGIIALREKKKPIPQIFFLQVERLLLNPDGTEGTPSTPGIFDSPIVLPTRADVHILG